ncbi:MAG: NADH-quinone oxidoreductase subunit B family protein [Chloroflexi bacterium]|nr:NADH-quinone oxidoreductase subunit B family protein [Chloroflexota bacterium]
MTEKNTFDLSNIDLSKGNPRNALVDRIRSWARINSPWAIHYNSGSCNGCDIELLTIITPRYDVERLGVKMAGTPRHADVLVVTGSVTLQSRDRLLRIYNQIPDPKFVLALGSCALSGGVFHDCYCCIQGGVDKVIPVDVYVPGCPPRPEAVIYGLVKLLDVIKNGKTNPTENKPTLIPSESELIDLERPAESA